MISSCFKRNDSLNQLSYHRPIYTGESKCLVWQNSNPPGEELFGIELVPGDFLQNPITIIVYKQLYRMSYLTLEFKHFSVEHFHFYNEITVFIMVA